MLLKPSTPCGQISSQQAYYLKLSVLLAENLILTSSLPDIYDVLPVIFTNQVGTYYCQLKIFTNNDSKHILVKFILNKKK
jgi:hypothetical protein